MLKPYTDADVHIASGNIFRAMFLNVHHMYRYLFRVTKSIQNINIYWVCMCVCEGSLAQVCVLSSF